MKTLRPIVLIAIAAFTLSACNDAFVAGLANGLANRPAPTYTSPSSSYDANAHLEQIKRDREAKKQERNMKEMCENTGGRWRVGRCKY